MEPLQKLQMIFREFFDDPTMTIAPGTSRETLADWDSVAHIQIVLAVEESFEMRFTTDQVAKLHSVADFLQILASRA